MSQHSPHPKGSPMRSPERRSNPSGRQRLDSKDIPRTYSGLFGDGNDLLPFELSRNRNTDWLKGGGWLLLGTYVSIIGAAQVAFLALFDFETSWSVTHVVHGLITLIFLHWIKGSFNYYEQGEMTHMTLWEQLESTHESFTERRALLVVPTLLCYAACHFGNYEPQLCVGNIVVWSVCMVAKMPFMNGVRLLGFNRTTGIDDDFPRKLD